MNTLTDMPHVVVLTDDFLGTVQKVVGPFPNWMDAQEWLLKPEHTAPVRNTWTIREVTSA